MLEFKKLELEDIELVQQYLNGQNTRLCDSTIGGIFMWRNYFQVEFVIYKNTLLFKVRYLDGKIAFTMPVGENVKEALAEIKEYCINQKIELHFCVVSKAQLEVLKENFPSMEAETERDWYDYLYDSQDMATFKGRRYSGQRNHMNKFKALYPEYRFEEITKDNLEEVIAFFEAFSTAHQKDSETAIEESKMVLELLKKYDIYKQMGGLIRVEDKIVAISVGEIVGDTLFIHIEKADRDYQGSYQMIVNQFAAHYVNEDVNYVNREEDVGDEGLRKSKLSYHPVELLEKYTVKVLL